MSYLKKCLFLVVICTIQCSAQKDRYKHAIQYVKQDTALYMNLSLENSTNGIGGLKKGNFEYRVHTYVVNEVLNEDASFCFDKLNVRKTVQNHYAGLNNFRHEELSKYSSSDSANIHIFFTDKYKNYLGVAVFYFENKNVSDQFDKFPYIWNSNHGAFYFLKFEEHTNLIEDVCKATLIYD